MDLANIKIKEEPNTIEFKCENEPRLDFKVKIKIESTPDDWCVQNTCSKTKNDNDSASTVPYDELKELCFQNCSLCGNVYHNAYNLLKHNISHVQVRLRKPDLFQCDECLVYYTKKDQLETHINLRHIFKKQGISKQMHQCRICLKIFKYKGWVTHMKNVHGKKVKCQFCNIIVKCERTLKRHILYVHEKAVRNWTCVPKDSQTVKCELCFAILNSIDALRRHMNNCHGKEVKCMVCGAKFKSTPYLRTHIQRVHYNDGKKHKCEICMKEFKSPRRVNIHIKNSHINKCLSIPEKKSFRKVFAEKSEESSFKIKKEVKVEIEN